MRQQFYIHRCANHHSAACVRLRQLRRNLRGQRLDRPQRKKNIRVHRRPHLRPRSLRISSTQALISFLPPGNVPSTALYLSNGLAVDRDGRITVRSPSTTNSTRSPAESPSRWRISCGTVTCPLLLMVLEYFILYL